MHHPPQVPCAQPPSPRHAGLAPEARTDWTMADVAALYAQPFFDLLSEAHALHRRAFPRGDVQLSTLLNIKSGGCPEDCAYCPQSAHYDAGVTPGALLDAEVVRVAARAAREAGATRFCMGAAWRSPRDRDVDALCAMISAVREEGLETCMTLGMLSEAQAARLSAAGLDYYNHNIDTSPGYYASIISTRRFEDRLETLGHVRTAGMKVCCGGIVGMGESRTDRVAFLHALATLPEHPQSVPVNALVPVDGTPLAARAEALDPFELVRTVAVARLLMPAARVRLSAGRTALDDATQALCFYAGANSIFYGEELLTTANPSIVADRALLSRLDLPTES